MEFTALQPVLKANLVDDGGVSKPEPKGVEKNQKTGIYTDYHRCRLKKKITDLEKNFSASTLLPARFIRKQLLLLKVLQTK